MSEALTQALNSLEAGPPPADSRLQTIFSKLRPTNGDTLPHFPLTPLKATGLAEKDQDPRDLWSEFDQKVNTLADGTGYFGTFSYLMFQFGSRVNAGKQHVSVAEHWRVVAALAYCLERDPDGEVLLVSNDFSGLYDFLMLVASRGAAKGFRGRSYFFQMLGQILARCILREFSLPLCNLLFEAASKFYLLLPGSVERELIKVRCIISDRLLQLHGGDVVPQVAYIRIQAADLLNRDRYPLAARLLHQAMQERAEQAVADLSPHRLGEFFGATGSGTASYCEACGTDLLEIEGRSLEDQDEGTDEGSRSKKLCSQCYSFGRTGPGKGLAQELATATCIVIRDKATGCSLADLQWDRAAQIVKGVADEAALSGWGPDSLTNRPTWHECVAYFGYQYGMLDSGTASSIAMEGGDEVLTLNPEATDWLPSSPNPGVTYGFRWVGQATPKEGKVIVDTTKMAKLAVPKEGSLANLGVERYGVLCLDGDGMGEAYEACESILEFVGLSSAQALFFEGWLNHLSRNAKGNALDTSDPRLDAYLLYVGGDDVLAVGTWQVVLDLAYIIRCHYGQYARAGIVSLDQDGYGPSPFTISGSVAVVPQKFPLYQAVRMAQEATHRSKDLGEKLRVQRLARGERYPDSPELRYPVKDCFTAFGVTVPWEQFGQAKDICYRLRDLLVGGSGRKPVSRSLLRRLEEIIRAHESAKVIAETRNGVPLDLYQSVIGPWMAVATYTLWRAYDEVSERAGNEVATWLLDLLKFKGLKAQPGVPQVINWIALPVRWVEILTRRGTTK